MVHYDKSRGVDTILFSTLVAKVYGTEFEIYQDGGTNKPASEACRKKK